MLIHFKIYNIPLMHHDFRNWQSTIYHYCVKPLFTSDKKDDFHKITPVY